ncbi:response regulator [Spirosoma arcticum]
MNNFYSNAKAQAGKHNFRGGSLLVVEDNPDHWMLIRHGLQQQLPEVDFAWAATAPQALEYVHTGVDQHLELPRLILLDLYLPERQDGFNFLTAIRTATPVLQRIPVVVLSSSHHKEDVREAYQLGSSSYLVKPTEPGEWEAYFKAIFEYWGRTATLPGAPPR